MDADDYLPEEAEALAEQGVAILPVSEIENLIALPTVSRAILEHEGFTGADLQSRMDEIANGIVAMLSDAADREKVVLRYCRRRIDRALKRIDLANAATEGELAAQFTMSVAAVDIALIAQSRRNRIQSALDNADLPALLALYDNKGVLAVAASRMKNTPKRAFESWLTRVLANDKAPRIADAVHAVLPQVVPS